MKKGLLTFSFIAMASCLVKAQTPVVFKELDIDPQQCLQINQFVVAHNQAALKELPLKYNAPCKDVDFGKINFEKKTLVACSQYVRNGDRAIRSTRVEVLRDDERKSIQVYFATFGTAQLQRPGKVFENRKWLLLPRFPEDYKVDVYFSLKVVEL